jgi:hypothetical protein
MPFHERQALMVRIDETLQQTRTATSPAPVRQTIINYPVINVQGATPATSGPSRESTPACDTPPIKVEAARQYTRLMAEERMELSRTGSCFRCRERGHMASQCPRSGRRIAAAMTAECNNIAPFSIFISVIPIRSALLQCLRSAPPIDAFSLGSATRI